MFEYFEGTIATVDPSYIVVDVNGVGYRLLVANPYSFVSGEKRRVFVQQIIRENEQSLYGFTDLADKATFNLLLTVTGIGPKSALAILANANTEGLSQAVASDDVTYLTKFPGIGKKTAQQIILDLKGKLEADEKVAAAPAANPALEDALAALVALGYSTKNVDSIKKKLEKEAQTDTDAYLRLGLRLLSGK